jgi:Flp pilus assembly protein TadG
MDAIISNGIKQQPKVIPHPKLNPRRQAISASHETVGDGPCHGTAIDLDGKPAMSDCPAPKSQRTKHPLKSCVTSKGQAMVEFIIGLILLIIVAWIPADFGLAFYTSQIAQNAAREGARIAAADPTLVLGNTTCNMPACYSFGNIFNETAARLPAALLTGASITVQYPSPASTGTCNQRVLVRVQGQYNFFFYRVLRLIGGSVPDSVTVNRVTEMRWEHQSGCVGGGTP